MPQIKKDNKAPRKWATDNPAMKEALSKALAKEGIILEEAHFNGPENYRDAIKDFKPFKCR